MRRLSAWSATALIALALLPGAASADSGEGARSPAGAKTRLGLVVQDLAFAELERLGLEHGVGVISVAPQGPAATAGLAPGDVIVALNGRDVYSASRLRWLVARLEAGREVALAYVRDGAEASASIAPAEAARRRARRPGAHAPHTYLGVSLQALSPDLREHFGAPPDSGVLVAEVFDESPAAQAGLVVGDVIVKMDRRQIGRVADVRRVLAYFDAGERVAVEIIRARRRETLSVTLAPPRQDESARGSPQTPDLPTLVQPEFWEEGLEQLLDTWEERWRDWREERESQSRQRTHRL